MIQQKRDGFVLLTTFLIIAAATLLVTQLARYTSVAYTLASLNSKKKQAHYLAISGVNAAISMLATPQDSEQEDTKEKSAPSDQKQPQQAVEKSKPNASPKNTDTLPLDNALFRTNKWHTINITDSKEGIEGTISFYITAECGKIPLNMLIDAEKGSLSDVGKKVVPFLDEKLKPLLANQSIREMIEKAIKTLKHPFDDVSQLIDEKSDTAKKLSTMLYITPEQGTALTDIFSLDDSAMMNPLFLSESVLVALGLSRPNGLSRQDSLSRPDSLSNKNTQKKELSAEALQKLKKEIIGLLNQQNIDWKAIWDRGVAPRTGKQYTDISQSVIELFSKRREETAFSVTARGTYQDVQQTVYAIIGSVVEKNDKDGTVKRFFYIKRIYWL